MREALLYQKLEDRFLQCHLCAHSCKIADQEFGFCGVRQNIGGVLYSLVYGRPVAQQIDPIEKKPLYHFLPGSDSFSLATLGCNFRCGFCQNWAISQRPGKEVLGLWYQDGGPDYLAPERIVQAALKNNCRSISYTYTEPTVFFEYALEVAKLAKAKGLYNIFVTNGFMTRECLEMLKPYLDAANVDLKFFKDSSYKKICAGSLEPVLNSIRLMREMGIWVEVTTLVVPAQNDSPDELKDIADFLANVDKDMPWHISRFHPDYKFTDYQPTPEATLRLAMDLGRQAGLTYIYAGNVWGWGNDTYCHQCKKLLIKREGFRVLAEHIKEGRCQYCQAFIPGLFLT
jgi:pyruvate formate lyase activating enzyme